MKTLVRWSAPVLAVALVGGCVSPQVAYNEKADFASIHRVAVAPFSGSGGDQAADMMLQDLLARGADVVERQRLEAVLREQQLSAAGILDPRTVKAVGKILGVDAIFVGTVTNLVTVQSYLVSAPGAGTVVVGAVTPIQGKNLHSEGMAPGLADAQILTSASSVGLIARMVDVETGSVLWSARMNYEGFDTETAMASITASFADSLVPIWPTLRKLR
jgi:curli biogenesis system outer membrane secretion channel CsgG